MALIDPKRSLRRCLESEYLSSSGGYATADRLAKS